MTSIVANKENFELGIAELKIIEKFEEELHNELFKILSNMVIREIVINNINYRIGFVHSSYQYRNDLIAYVRESNINKIDVLGMVTIDKDTVSFRTVNNADVSIIATYFGGKGHKEASSSPKDNEKLKEFVMMFE